MNWTEYFEMLKDWKMLPAYKVEPRIDSLIGHYLPKIISDFLGVESIGIIPELPIRLATVKPEHEGTYYADRSYKVDFLIIGNNNLNFLVEFKTDSRSRRDAQDTYLSEAKTLGTKSIIDGIIQISRISTYKVKYKHLREKLLTYGLIDIEDRYTGLNPGFEIVYVQPSNHRNEKNVIDFKRISNWLKSNYPNAEFENELADSLLLWSKD
jgi:hypothetical protein